MSISISKQLIIKLIILFIQTSAWFTYLLFLINEDKTCSCNTANIYEDLLGHNCIYMLE